MVATFVELAVFSPYFSLWLRLGMRCYDEAGGCLHDFYAPLASPRVLRLLLLPVQPRLTAFVGGQQGQKLVTAGVQAQYEDPHD